MSTSTGTITTAPGSTPSKNEQTAKEQYLGIRRVLLFLIYFEKCVTPSPKTVLIGVKAFETNGKEMNALDDSKIVALYLRRDEAAIEQTSQKYGNRLRALSYGIVQDRQTAEECENDTYLKAWNAIPPHEPGHYLYAFLARITRRISLNCCRRRERLKRSAFLCELSAEMEQCIPAPDDAACRLDERTLREAINAFLATLSEEKRNLFLRRYWYLDSIADISKRYALPESKVKTTLFRCRNRLREHLEKEGYIL